MDGENPNKLKYVGIAVGIIAAIAVMALSTKNASQPTQCMYGDYTPCEVGKRTGVLQSGPSACPKTKEEDCIQNCIVSDWSDWADCDVPCGMGTQKRTREIKQPAVGGIPCPDLAERKECSQRECSSRDCRVSDWDNWGSCSEPCGQFGVRTRERTVLQPASEGGYPCPQRMTDIDNCNTEIECPVNCEVSSWTDFGICSMTCGGGVNTRTRVAIKYPYAGGTACPPLAETGPCNEQPCPVNCELSDWSEWGECSQPCGQGDQVRYRSVKQSPQHGGTNCLDTEQHQPCNTQECSRNCQVSQWSEWSACVNSTGACGAGSQRRTRNITIQNNDQGAICPAREETKSCRLTDCPIDCVVGDWGDWHSPTDLTQSCDRTCGAGWQVRTRPVLTEPANRGLACPDTEQGRFCNTDICSKDCQLSPWSNWSGCSLTCGGGTQSRSRMIFGQPEGAGKICPLPEDLTEYRSCNEQQCPEACKIGDWSSWSPCQKTDSNGIKQTVDCGGGMQRRTRSVINSATTTTSCPSTEEVKQCGVNECPADCKVSSWSNWSECDELCGGGSQIRTRTVREYPNSTGKTCPKLIESRTCNENKCDARYPRLSAWSNWSKCSTCGDELQSRERIVLKSSTDPSIPRPLLNQIQPCSNEQCPVDCKVTEWAYWSECDAICGTGHHYRTKFIQTPPRAGGKECPLLLETGACNNQPCPINCEVYDWEKWSECIPWNGSCGDGHQRRTRAIKVRSEYGGIGCPVLEEEINNCPTIECAGDCEIAVGTWSECKSATTGKPVTCGGGIKTMDLAIRKPAIAGGKPCDFEAIRKAKAENGASVGLQTFATPINGASARLTTTCNTAKCPVDCKLAPTWSEWFAEPKVNELTGQPLPNYDDWSHTGATCSHTCHDASHNGIQVRTKAILVHENGGTACTEYGPVDKDPFNPTADVIKQSRPCNENPCPVDCVITWSNNWGPCSSTCGSGVRTMMGRVDQAPNWGGKPCVAPTGYTFLPDASGKVWNADGTPANPSIQKPCTPPPCPINCVAGAWSGWNATGAGGTFSDHQGGFCSKEFAGQGGRQYRTRPITTLDQYGGAVCPGDTSKINRATMQYYEARDCNNTFDQCEGTGVGCGAWIPGVCLPGTGPMGCGTGVQTFTRFRDTSNGCKWNWQACDEDNITSKTGPCQNTKCPIHCEIAWNNDWSDCTYISIFSTGPELSVNYLSPSTPCGRGIQTQTFRVTQNPNTNDNPYPAATPCPTTVCRNGVCPTGAHANSFQACNASTCICDDFHTGDHCEIPRCQNSTRPKTRDTCGIPTNAGDILAPLAAGCPSTWRGNLCGDKACLNGQANSTGNLINGCLCTSTRDGWIGSTPVQNKPKFQGTYCEQNICYNTGAQIGNLCQCTGVFSGDNCLDRCVNGNFAGGVCTCNANWTGATCETRVCKYGTLQSNNTCDCNVNYAGEFCDKLICTGEQTPDNTAGLCAWHPLRNKPLFINNSCTYQAGNSVSANITQDPVTDTNIKYKLCPHTGAYSLTTSYEYGSGGADIGKIANETLSNPVKKVSSVFKQGAGHERFLGDYYGNQTSMTVNTPYIFNFSTKMSQQHRPESAVTTNLNPFTPDHGAQLVITGFNSPVCPVAPSVPAAGVTGGTTGSIPGGLPAATQQPIISLYNMTSPECTAIGGSWEGGTKGRCNMWVCRLNDSTAKPAPTLPIKVKAISIYMPNYYTMAKPFFNIGEIVIKNSAGTRLMPGTHLKTWHNNNWYFGNKWWWKNTGIVGFDGDKMFDATVTNGAITSFNGSYHSCQRDIMVVDAGTWYCNEQATEPQITIVFFEEQDLASVKIFPRKTNASGFDLSTNDFWLDRFLGAQVTFYDKNLNPVFGGPQTFDKTIPVYTFNNAANTLTVTEGFVAGSNWNTI